MISRNAKLDYQLGSLVVRSSIQTKRIHLSEIAVLIIESTAVSLTSYLVNELINRKIKVVFCDQKHNPAGEIVPYYGHFETSRLILDQINLDPEKKKIPIARALPLPM